MTKKIFSALAAENYPNPNYEAIEPDSHFREVSQTLLAEHPNIIIRDGKAFDGDLHKSGKRNLVTGINSIYFANDLSSFKDDLSQTLESTGMGIFIQNKASTEKLKEALTKNKAFTAIASIPTEIYFPNLPEAAWDLIVNRKSAEDIGASTQLDEIYKDSTILTKKIIDAMGGISTETEQGQENAIKWRDRILGDDFGGAGKSVSDNYMLVYLPPNAPNVLKEIVSKAVKDAQKEVLVASGLTL